MATVTYISFDLRAALKQAGMTAAQLSRVTNIDQAQLSRYANGDVEPSPRNAGKLAEALGLLRDDGERVSQRVTVSADAV